MEVVGSVVADSDDGRMVEGEEEVVADFVVVANVMVA